MPTGIATPLGYSNRNVAGFNPLPQIGNHPLYYEDPLTSYSPNLNNYGFISPLSMANESLYSFNQKFGIRKNSKNKDCKKFNKNRSVNPSTGRPIKRNGKLYNKLERKCKKLRISKVKCVQFLDSNKQINPFTGKLIKKDGKIYNLFMKKCVKYFDKNIQLSGSFANTGTQTNYSVNSVNTQTDIPPMFVGRLPGIPSDEGFNTPISSPKPNLLRLTTANPYISSKRKLFSSSPVIPTYKVTKSGINYELSVGNVPNSYIKYNGLEFKPDNLAIFDSNGNASEIASIGASMIMFKPISPDGKIKRITHETFIKLNNSSSSFGNKKFIQSALKKMRKKGTLGSFKRWCKRNGLLSADKKVTRKCINAGKKSKNLKIKRRAIFAQNIRRKN
jgi:hypothetical protein